MRALVCLLVVSLAASCGKSEPPPAEQPRAPEVAPDATRPAGMLATVSLGAPRPFFEGAYELFESRLLRAFAPTGTGALLTALGGLPPAIAKRVPSFAPLAGIVLDEGGAPVAVFAVRLEDVALGVAPLGGGVETRPGGPSGGFIVRDPGVDAQPEVALVGDLLFVSSSREALARAHRHLAHLLKQGGDEKLRVEFEAEALARHLRPVVEERARAMADEALESVRALREETGRAPELGDPEPLIERGRALALELASLLPDLEDARLEVGFQGSLGLVELRVVATPNSPLSRALEALAPAEEGLAALMQGLPASAGIALGVADGSRLARGLELAGAERLSEGDRARLDALFPSRPHTITIGGDASGGYARLARAGEGALGDEALAVPHLRTLLGALADCAPPKRAPRFAAGSAPFCRDRASETRVVQHEEGPAQTLTLATRARETAPDEPRPGAELAAAGADASRALASLDASTALAAYLEASRVIPSLALRSRFLELRALASDAPPRPVITSLGVEGREARVRAAFTRGSVDRFLVLFAEGGRILAEP